GKRAGGRRRALRSSSAGPVIDASRVPSASSQEIRRGSSPELQLFDSTATNGRRSDFGGARAGAPFFGHYVMHGSLRRIGGGVWGEAGSGRWAGVVCGRACWS